MRVLVHSVLLSGIASVASAETRPFPLVQVALDSQGSIRLVVDAEALAELRGHEELVLTGVPLPDADPVDVSLERVRVLVPSGDVLVDGVATPSRADVTLWSGEIVGQPGSQAFFGFSPHGSRGWIHSEEGLVHLLAHPDVERGWEAAHASLVKEETLRAMGAEPQVACETEQLAGRGGALPSAPRTTPGVAEGTSLLPIYDGRIAVETDFQFFQLFNDLSAAQSYAFTLFGAVSARYREQVGVILTAPYFAFYTSNDDPWTEQDAPFGASCIDVLFEFQDAWNLGQAPVEANIYHMFSGAPLGCGVAYLDALCEDEFNFSVSGQMDGNTPFPVAQGPINWDFIVVAHELGHNFASPHTHDYEPPIDQCASGGGGCIPNGSLMSYCHLCPGGYNNMTTFFHPTVIDVMRTAVEESCLELFEGVLPEDLGNSLAGGSSDPRLQVFYDAGNMLHRTTQAPPGSAGVLVWSLDTSFTPFLGGTLVPEIDFLVGLGANGAGVSDLIVSPSGSFPSGINIIAQSWWIDGLGFSASNGVDTELILP